MFLFQNHTPKMNDSRYYDFYSFSSVLIILYIRTQVLLCDKIKYVCMYVCVSNKIKCGGSKAGMAFTSSGSSPSLWKITRGW